MALKPTRQYSQQKHLTPDPVFDLIQVTMQTIERKSTLDSVLSIIEENQEERLLEAYEQALSLLALGYQERRKKDEALLDKLFCAHELLKSS